MTDPNEIEALKASMRGVLAAAEALKAVAGKVDQFDPHADVSAADLEELSRLSLANAVAAQALRGLVGTMRARRDLPAA
jgi:hypothetical protein